MYRNILELSYCALLLNSSKPYYLAPSVSPQQILENKWKLWKRYKPPRQEQKPQTDIPSTLQPV